MRTVNGLQDRVERSANGRAVITGFLLFTLVALVVSNVPRGSPIHAGEDGAFRPFLHATGLRQRWGVFSPDPTPETLYVSAVVIYADGSKDTWTFPRGERVLGVYRVYRWRQFARDAQNRANRGTLWPSVAAWVAREKADEGRSPVSVTLVRTYRATPSPGVDVTNPWTQEAYYRLDLRTGRGHVL